MTAGLAREKGLLSSPPEPALYPFTISILVPSRGRPENIRRLYRSLEETTLGRWELLVRLDDDDPALREYESEIAMTRIVGKRLMLAELWNDLLPSAEGDVLMLCGDDVTFNTKHWDREIVGAFPVDGIGVVHGNDLSPNSATIATHPFVSRKWVKTLGYLAPPYFTSDYVDLWLTEVADRLERRSYLPDVVFEHHHPAFKKAVWDRTYQERVERADGMEKVWADTLPLRIKDAQKLRLAIG